MMTLDEAIKHCNEVACKHDKCAMEHKQLSQWLMELKGYKERNLADKVEPKFHKGDWAVSNLDGKARQISEVHFDEYNSYYVVDGKSVNLEEYDRLHHLWTIQDAKDGDVLAYNDGSLTIFHYRLSGLDAGLYMSHVLLSDKIEFKQTCAISNSHPATKEQRDTLMKSMADAGYTFDFEKKELKKIEQNLVIEMKTPEESLGVDSDIYNKIVDECIYGEQKPAEWSEEDERIYRGIHNLIYSTPYCDSRKEFSDWLKSLKDRCLLQPQQEWSEKDVINLTNTIRALQSLGMIQEADHRYDNLVDWLKSLRPQKHWKPSEEQMQALSNAGNFFRPFEKNHKVLWSLYNDLKKLKEE